MEPKAIMWFPGRGPMIFGFLLFGHILPFIGWETIPCHWDGQPADYHDTLNADTDGRYTCQLFNVEWLGFGVTLGWPRNIQPA